MKILYAAGNRIGSFYQLKRFLGSVSKRHTIKIAAYKKSMGDLDVDYNLDSLLNFTNPEGISFNGNYNYYANEIRRFAPDLIISDFEIYTSIMAGELKIKLWQFSPVNLYYALDAKTKQASGIHKYYSHLIESNHKKSDYINYILNNSDRKFVLSHLCDCAAAPSLIDGFEWVRPSFILGEGGSNFDNVIVLPKTNKKIIDEFKNKNSILFSPFYFEKYDRMLVANINSDDYALPLDNCKIFITDGTATFLADAFYNQKYCFSITRYDDIEAVIGSFMNEYCKLGKMDLGNSSTVEVTIDDNVKFISEHLEEV